MSVPNDRRARSKEQRPPVVIHDRRRIDPVTLELRATTEEPGPGPSPNTGAAASAGRPPNYGPDAGSDRRRRPHSHADEPHARRESGREQGPAASEIAELRSQLSERTADLQRTKAEYDNYRKRVRRDRSAVQRIAVSNVLDALLPVLDTVVRAREHGETSMEFTSVADLLEERLAALGLQPVGEVGEPFDPTAHEALDYTESEQQERPVCSAVLRPGYRVGDHLLRPAQVLVTGPPAAGAGGAGTGTSGSGAAGDG